MESLDVWGFNTDLGWSNSLPSWICTAESAADKSFGRDGQGASWFDWWTKPGQKEVSEFTLVPNLDWCPPMLLPQSAQRSLAAPSFP
jgi:hypothetical protein